MAGASSFHLWWQIAGLAPLAEVEAVCEVLVPPRGDHLYFWALQIGFSDGQRSFGAAHVGLQWHGSGTSGRAVNWGGYHRPADGGGELAGSMPTLPPLNRSGNTARYDWEPGNAYRFRVFRSHDAWRAEVSDVNRHETTVIRDLFAGGHLLTEPVVWSEAFAPCDDPAVKVRWSGLRGRAADGASVRPAAVTVTYQDPRSGGCPNTTAGADDVGLLQTTGCRREVADRAEVTVPVPGPPSRAARG